MPVFQRGGTIVPLKTRVRRSSTLAAHDPFTLIVALSSEVCVCVCVCVLLLLLLLLLLCLCCVGVCCCCVGV
jgi:hypothetical protein